METPVGGSKCSWGPAYWCSTPEAAIECNVRMCISADWHEYDVNILRCKTLHPLYNCSSPLSC